MRNSRFLLRCSMLVALSIFMATGTAWAQLARVSVTVSNEEGETLEGVSIRAVQEDTGVDVERSTNKKGKATFAFRNGVMRHELTLTHPGYDGLVHSLTPGGGTSHIELKLQKAGVAAAEDQGESAEASSKGGRLTAAQEIFNEGVAAVQAKDYATAEAKFRAALEKDSDLFVTHLALGGIYLEQERFPEAKTAANTVLALDDQNIRAYRILHEAHVKLGEVEDADKVLEKMSKIESGGDAAAIVYNEGAEALKLGENDRGIERLERALVLDPTLAPAMRLLALVYQATGKHEMALAKSEQFLVASPGDARILKVRWESLSALGRDEEASAALEELKDLDPTVLIKDYFDAGQEAFNQGDTATAMANFEKILSLKPDHPQAHYFMGLCNVNLGKSSEAKTHFEKFIELAPGDPQVATAREMLTFL